ncbi:MAG: hypothetical protein Q9M39_07820 [Sulfurovum sp.]|nr:hypothetical protein [Sulfurovum sp.]
MPSDNTDVVGVEHPSQEKQITLTETELLKLIENSIEEVVTTTIERKEQFSGPVPHPDHMLVYKGIDKTLPNRFTTMAEKHQSHNMFIEKAIVLGELGLGVLGWLTPTALSFYVLNAAIGFVSDGKSIEALVALVVALGSLGGAFYIKNRDKKEKTE